MADRKTSRTEQTTDRPENADERPEASGSDPVATDDAAEAGAGRPLHAVEHDPRADSVAGTAAGGGFILGQGVEPEAEPVVEPEAEPERQPESAAEPEDRSDPEPASEKPRPPAQPAGLPAPTERREKTRRGGFFAAFAGGIVAAILGFAAARSDMLDPLLPPAWRSADYAAEIEALERADAAQAETLAELGDSLGAIEIPDLAPLEERLAGLAEQVEQLGAGLSEIETAQSELNDRLDPIDRRLNDVEKRPMDEGVSEAAIAAYERELSGLQEAVAAQRAEVERLLDEARAKDAEARAAQAQASQAAQVAAIRTSLAQLRGALDAGAPYGGLIGALSDAGVDVPEDLRAPAADGVATMAELRNGFPPAARAALSDARASGENGGAGGLGAFLTRHLGARSVAPRDGDDPDAILSRAEAALTAGDLARTLEELDALPETARAAMSDWAAPARTRLAAVQAADTLAQSLNSN